MIDDDHVLKAALRQEFRSFVELVFRIVSPGDEFIDNWHIDAIAWHLQQCAEGDIRKLVITQPPRSLKSICASVALPAWLLGRDPTCRVVCVSYSNELSMKLARQFRQVVSSDEYKALFPGMHLVKSAEGDFETTKGGGRLATSVGGTLTGRGGDIVIIDDPIKPGDASSETIRRKTLEWYSGTLASRRDDPKAGVTILVMQRLHEEDLAGHLLDSGMFTHLNLPAIAQEDQEVPTGRGRFHLFRKGELLQPDREGEAELAELRATMGSMVFSAQYLQQPVPADGNLIKRAWFRQYFDRPGTGQVIQSWDTASSVKDTADFSACVTALAVNRQLFILDVFRDRLAYPDLKREIVKRAGHFGASTVLIEDAGSGMHLLAELKREPRAGAVSFIGRKPDGEKAQRMEAASTMIESGNVALPADSPWLLAFLHEVLAFPNARNDDQVDALSQLINWYRGRVGILQVGIGPFGIVPAGEIISVNHYDGS